MKKFIGLCLAVAILCMAFPSMVFANSQALRSYTDLGEFVYENPELGVECRANARWAINRVMIYSQITAPKAEQEAFLRTESEIIVYWANERGKHSGEYDTKPMTSDRFGGGVATYVDVIFPKIGRGGTYFADYITSEVRFYADDVLVCECTFDKMAYAGLYND